MLPNRFDPTWLACHARTVAKRSVRIATLRHPASSQVARPAISTPAIPNRVRKAGCRVRAVADGLVEKSFMRSAHLAGKGGSLNSLAPCGQLGRIYMRLSPEDGHPSYFPARQQQRSIDNPRAGCRLRQYPTQHGACTINDQPVHGGSALAEPSSRAADQRAKLGAQRVPRGGTVRSISRQYPALHGHSSHLGAVSSESR